MDAQWSNTINFIWKTRNIMDLQVWLSILQFAILLKQENGPRIFHVKDLDLILLATLKKLIGIIGEDKIFHCE